MPFVKGQSGNPKGRAPKAAGVTTLADVLRARLGEVDEATGLPLRQVMMGKLVTMALSGDLDAIKVVLERVDGKVPELRTVEGKLQIHLSWDDGSNDAD